MTTQIITKIHNIILVCTVAVLMACSDGSSASKDDSAHVKVAPTPSAAKNSNYSEFKEFFAEFVSSVEHNDWLSLKQLTHFPLIIKGELDDEGTVIITSDGFPAFVTSFLKEETYLTINDELVATSYADSLTAYQDQLKLTSDSAELNNFIFKKDGKYWKLAEIVTYLHLIEKYKDESK